MGTGVEENGVGGSGGGAGVNGVEANGAGENDAEETDAEDAERDAVHVEENAVLDVREHDVHAVATEIESH